MDKNNFMGLSGFVWWLGEIEYIGDGIQAGRCKVRIFGWHTDVKTQLPTGDLPWAQPLFAYNASKIWQAPDVGDWAVGFFLDGENAQHPVILGILPGIKQEDKQ